MFFPFLNCENDTKSCEASFNIFVWRLPSELKYHYIIISTKVRHNIIQLFMLLYVFKLLFYFKNYSKFVLLIDLSIIVCISSLPFFCSSVNLVNTKYILLSFWNLPMFWIYLEGIFWGIANWKKRLVFLPT